MITIRKQARSEPTRPALWARHWLYRSLFLVVAEKVLPRSVENTPLACARVARFSVTNREMKTKKKNRLCTRREYRTSALSACRSVTVPVAVVTPNRIGIRVRVYCVGTYTIIRVRRIVFVVLRTTMGIRFRVFLLCIRGCIRIVFAPGRMCLRTHCARWSPYRERISSILVHRTRRQLCINAPPSPPT
jgi:hypothetical protein